MALRGNLRDFSLPDVFQLVTFSRKTGVLRIAREGGAEGSVWFRDGDVFFASSNWRTELLGERLVSAQRITPQALKRALALRAEEPEEGRRLGQILVDEGYITEEVLEAFVQEQIQDTIFDLMRWDEGDFDFEAMPDVVDEDIGLVGLDRERGDGGLRAASRSGTGSRRRSRPSRSSSRWPPRLARARSRSRSSPRSGSCCCWWTARAPCAELASETGRTDFEVARVLYGLFSAGLLEFASDEEVERHRAERATREAKLAQLETERGAEAEARQAAATERSESAAAKGGLGRGLSALIPTGPSSADSVEQAPAEPVPVVPSKPAEVPDLPRGRTRRCLPTTTRPCSTQFMGAVLGQQIVEQPEVKPSAPARPHTPVEEPAFMSDAARDNEMVDEPEVLIEDLLGMTPQPLPEAVPIAEPEPVAEPVVEVAPEPEPVAEPVVEVAPEPEPEIAPVVEVAPEPEPEIAPEVAGGKSHQSPNRSRRFFPRLRRRWLPSRPPNSSQL